MIRFIIIVLIPLSMMGCDSRNRAKINKVSSDDKMILIESEDKSQIPVNLIKVISDSLIGFTIPTEEDLDPKFLSSIKDNVHPFFCKQDYDGNGEIDYGFILKSKENTINLFIFNSIEGNFKITNLGSINLGTTDKGLATIISNEEKGDWSSIDTSFYVANTGISLQLLEESRTRYYYWDGKKYARFFAD